MTAERINPTWTFQGKRKDWKMRANPGEEGEDLGDLVAKIRDWPSLLTPLPHVSESSPIRSLEQEYPQVHIRTGVEFTILQAEEGVRAASELTGSGRPRYPFSVYPLARSSIELAACAYWILTARSEEEMLSRFCAHELKELSYHKTRGSGLDLDISVLEKNESILQASLVRLTGDTKLNVPSPSEMTLALGKAAEGSDGQWLSKKWSFLSALTHGSSWTRDMYTDSQDLGPPGGPRAITQDKSLADLSLLSAAWSVQQAHEAYSKVSGVNLSGRLPVLATQQAIQASEMSIP